jgi:hypothetical protein
LVISERLAFAATADTSGIRMLPLAATAVLQPQTNYVITSLDTFAWIGIEQAGTTYILKGIGLAAVASAVGLFNSNGLAAASAVSVAPDETQTPVPVSFCSGASRTSVATIATPETLRNLDRYREIQLPINVSGNQVYLSLYGTGFDSVPIGMQCFSDSLSLPVTYAGPQKQTPGLDQINLKLPASLAGTGTVSITC